MRCRRTGNCQPRRPGLVGPRSQSKGDVFALAQFLEPDLNFGQVRQLLRALCGTAPSFPLALAARKEMRPELSPGARWIARRSLTRGSPTWCYLARTRALEEPVLVAAARADALREDLYASAWFAHRDAAATIVGIEMRGPEYRGFSADGDKTLFQLAGRLPASSVAVRRLVVCEAPIDAMSLAGIERLRADTVYVSTAGGMGRHTIRRTAGIAARPGDQARVRSGGGDRCRHGRGALRQPAGGTRDHRWGAERPYPALRRSQGLESGGGRTKADPRCAALCSRRGRAAGMSGLQAKPACAG